MNTRIALAAGAAIGTMGNASGGVFDLGGYDGRSPPLGYVNPARTLGSSANQAICPLDYFVPALADSRRASLGGWRGHRTVAPLCGTPMQDVGNTAQGRWYFNAAENEDPHLALVHDNVDATLGAFS